MLIPKRAKGGAGPQSISNLTDVAVTAPQAGEVLAFDATLGKWTNIELLFSRVGGVLSVDTAGKLVSVSFSTGGSVTGVACSMANLPTVGQQVVVEFLADGSAVVTGAVLQPFSPATITGLEYWFDASDLGTLVRSGNNVTGWLDKSGGTLNVTPEAEAPTLSTAPNGRPALLFSHSTMASTKTIPAPVNTTHFAVVRVSDPTNGGSVNGQQIASQNLTNYFGVGNVYETRGWQVSRPGAAPVWSLGPVTAALCLVTATTTPTISVNGTALSTNPIGGPDATYTSPQAISIGGVGGYPAESFQGLICEVIRFSRVLSQTEIASVQSYLNQKWSL